MCALSPHPEMVSTPSMAEVAPLIPNGGPELITAAAAGGRDPPIHLSAPPTGGDRKRERASINSTRVPPSQGGLPGPYHSLYGSVRQ